MGNTVLWVAVASGAIAGLMELLKHKVYKDKATTTAMTLWGVGLSALITPVIYYGFGLMGTPVAMLLYVLLIYLVQKDLDMEVVRPIVKAVVQRKMDQI